MGKDPRENAKIELVRAKNYYDAKQYKKAGNQYNKAADIYSKLLEHKDAKESFFNAAKSFLEQDKYEETIDALRSAGNSALYMDDFQDASQFFKNALKYVSRLRSEEERSFNYVLYSSLNYLCLFIEGKQDQGLNFVKDIKNKVDDDYFNQNPLVILIKNLTIAVRDKNQDYLKKVEENFEKYKFRKAEGVLMKKVLLLAKTHISINTELSLDKSQYTTRDFVKMTLKIDTSSLPEISNYAFYNYTIQELSILNIGLTMSDNFSAQKKPELPIHIIPGQPSQLEFLIKPQFMVDTPFIGPILLTCELDKKYVFFLKTDLLKPNIIPPPPSLDVSYKILKTPLIDQTFPLEIVIENKSKGDAVEVDIDIELPPQLALIRGTLKKQIYSISSNENAKWELNLKPTEAGDFPLKMNLKFKDQELKLIEDTKLFDISIKL